MQKVSAKVSNINIEVGLDDKNIPEQIHWDASDAEPGKHESCRHTSCIMERAGRKPACALIFGRKEMTIPEMNIFVFQTLLGMSDTFERATHNKTGANDLRQFAKTFFDKIQSNE
jgi:gliding motility-associated protein GldC